MLEGESIVEDVGVGNRRGGLTDLLQEGASAGALEREFFEENRTRLTTHTWATGLAVATAAIAAMTNAAFIASNYAIESAGGRE